jgi:hypothetical protein
MHNDKVRLTMIESHKLFDYLIANREKLTLFSDRQIADLATKALGFAVTEAHVFTRRESAGIARERYAKKAPETSLDVKAGFSALLATLEKTGFVSASESAEIMQALQSKGGK